MVSEEAKREGQGYSILTDSDFIFLMSVITNTWIMMFLDDKQGGQQLRALGHLSPEMTTPCYATAVFIGLGNNRIHGDPKGTK